MAISIDRLHWCYKVNCHGFWTISLFWIEPISLLPSYILQWVISYFTSSRLTAWKRVRCCVTMIQRLASRQRGTHPCHWWKVRFLTVCSWIDWSNFSSYQSRQQTLINPVSVPIRTTSLAVRRLVILLPADNLPTSLWFFLNHIYINRTITKWQLSDINNEFRRLKCLQTGPGLCWEKSWHWSTGNPPQRIGPIVFFFSGLTTWTQFAAMPLKWL